MFDFTNKETALISYVYYFFCRLTEILEQYRRPEYLNRYYIYSALPIMLKDGFSLASLFNF